MIYLQTYDSPLGTIYLQGRSKYLTGLSFNKPQTDRSQLVCQTTPALEKAKRWLEMYFQGLEPDFLPPYRFYGQTAFQVEVTEIMRQIPYGQTITYGQIARKILRQRGSTKMSPQAIGGAVGANPICLVVPCHRVMGTDGKLIGYSGGIERKIELLKLEGYPII